MIDRPKIRVLEIIADLHDAKKAPHSVVSVYDMGSIRRLTPDIQRLGNAAYMERTVELPAKRSVFEYASMVTTLVIFAEQNAEYRSIEAFPATRSMTGQWQFYAGWILRPDEHSIAPEIRSHAMLPTVPQIEMARIVYGTLGLLLSKATMIEGLGTVKLSKSLTVECHRLVDVPADREMARA